MVHLQKIIVLNVILKALYGLRGVNMHLAFMRTGELRIPTWFLLWEAFDETRGDRMSLSL